MSRASAPDAPVGPLAVADLRVVYAGTERAAVAGVTLSVGQGEVLGLIGESGSGKSTLAYTTVAHTPGAQVSGRVEIDGVDVLPLTERHLRQIRGSRVTVVHQNPQSALNPAHRVGAQIAEQIRLHTRLDRAAVERRVLDLLSQVRFDDPASVARRYPHELSGGQQQRIVIAMALSCEPDVVVMDEPTTGLDVTTEAHIMDLISDLRATRDFAVLFISHDLPLVASVADRIAVMRHGEVVETGPVVSVLTEPEHPYTRELVGAMASMGRAAAPRGGAAPRQGAALRATRLRRTYAARRRGGADTVALDDVDLTVPPGRTVAVVGESGSGKSTLIRCLTGLTTPDAGEVRLGDRVLGPRLRDRTRAERRTVQMVFQNPDSSLNPRHRVGTIIGRPIELYEGGTAADRRARVDELLDQVRLPREYASRFAAQLSGGEKQRVAVARAFAARPSVILLDEPTSALDAAVQRDLLALLRRLQDEESVAYLFITHDFGAVRTIADDIVVMQRGRVVEAGPAGQILDRPQEAYTRELMAATTSLSEVLEARGAR